MALLMKIIESIFWQTINNNANIYHARNLYIHSDRNIKLKWFFHYNDENAFNVMKGYISTVNLGIRIILSTHLQIILFLKSENKLIFKHTNLTTFLQYEQT